MTNGDAVLTEVHRILTDAADADGNYVVPSDQIGQAINRATAYFLGEVGYGKAWATVKTLDTTHTAYDLATTHDYASIVRLRFVTDGLVIGRVSQAEIDAAHEGGPAHGRPTRHCLRRNASGGVTFVLDTLPSEAEDVEALLSYVPDTYTVAESPDVDIPVSARGARSIELRSAAYVLKALGEERVSALAIDKSVANDWLAEAVALDQREKQAIAWLKVSQAARGGEPVFAAWVRG